MTDHARKLLGIYLNDHLAALVSARELAKRANAGATDNETRAIARDLVAHLTRSERELERLLSELGVRPSRVKRALASAAEKGGRVKLNGHVVSRSPLSDLVELEGLSALLQYEAALWRVLADAIPELARPEGDFGNRERDARDWRDGLTARARSVAPKALGRPTGVQR
jgi:hypothetical protein